MTAEKRNPADISGNAELPTVRSPLQETSVYSRARLSEGNRLNGREPRQAVDAEREVSGASQIRGPARGSDASDSAKPVLDPLLRAFPDHLFLEESQSNPQLGDMLRQVVILAEQTLGSANVLSGIRLARIDDPDESGWVRRAVRIRVPRMPRERRDQLWNRLIDSYEGWLHEHLASITPASRRRAVRRLAESIFIELEMR